MRSKKREFKILCIDGGGIRGVIPSKFLSKVEDHFRDENGDRVKLHEYFDLICGTSTGAIIAIGLGLGMTSKEIHSLYCDNAIKIFGSPKFSFLRKVQQLFRSKHSRKSLEGILEESFKRYSYDNDTRLGHSKTRLCVPAFNGSTGSTVVFKTAHHKDYIRDYQIPAYQVALATSAAPTYFSPYKIKYKDKITGEDCSISNMIDGGIYANNPALIGLSEALALGYTFDEIKILSIGTGSTTLTYKKQKNRINSGAIGWINPFREVPLAELMMQSQSSITENIMKIISEGVHHDNLGRFSYLRYQHKFEENDKITMDSTSKATTDLMNLKASSMFENCDRKLLQPFFYDKVVPYIPFKRVTTL